MSAAPGAGAAAAARIGPNAVTRLAEALRESVGEAAAALIFEQAGLARHLARPPQHMVPEAEVMRLHLQVRVALPRAQAREVTREAGVRTGRYLLAHRIPRAVQAMLRWLPPRLAARVLLGAISRHAWTFAGSGRFACRVAGQGPVELTLRDNPLCRGMRQLEPACDYYAATFETLFRALVHPHARVRETACEARGDALCRFEVTGLEGPRA